MIKLEIEEYCQDCPQFEAEVENPVPLYAAGMIYEYVGDTTIRCEHRERCKNVYKHAKKNLINED